MEVEQAKARLHNLVAMEVAVLTLATIIKVVVNQIRDQQVNLEVVMDLEQVKDRLDSLVALEVAALTPATTIKAVEDQNKV